MSVDPFYFLNESDQPITETKQTDPFFFLEDKKSEDPFHFLEGKEKIKPSFGKVADTLLEPYRVEEKTPEELASMPFKDKQTYSQDLARQRQLQQSRGFVRGGLSGLTIGASEYIPGLKPQEEDLLVGLGKATGSYLPITGLYNLLGKPLVKVAAKSPIFKKGLESLARIAGWGATGATYEGAQELVKGEVPSPKELAKEAGKWATIDAILRTVGTTLEFSDAVSNIARAEGVSRKDIIGRLWDSAKNFMKQKKSFSTRDVNDVLMSEARKAEAEAMAKPEEAPITIEAERPEAAPTEEKVAAIAEKEIKPPEEAEEPLAEKHIAPVEEIEQLKTAPETMAKKSLSQQLGDTRGKGTQYHGTPHDIEKPSSEYYNVQNIYGQGFYTTDAIDIAEGYSKRKTKGEKNPTIYEVKEKNPIEFYDMDQPIDPALKQQIAQLPYSEIETFLSDDPSQTLTQLFDEIRQDSDRPAAEIQEDFDSIQRMIEKMGYGGMRHVGGKLTGKNPHSVKIYFHPESQIEIDKITPEKKPTLTPQQIRNRQIALANAEKMQKKRVQDFKEQQEKERLVASRILQSTHPKETSKAVDEMLDIDEDIEDLEMLHHEMVEANDPEKEQAYAEQAYRSDKVAQKLAKVWSKFDIEAPFKAVDAPETGRAAKLYFDRKNAALEQARGVVKKWVDVSPTREERWNDLLAAETGFTTNGSALVRDYFDNAYTQYESAGGLRKPYPQSLIDRLQQEIEELQSSIKPGVLKAQALGKKRSEIAKRKNLIERLKKIKYVPKPRNLIKNAIAEQLSQMNPVKAGQFAISAHKKRMTAGLKDWVDQEPAIKENLDPLDILAHYATNQGKDLALLKIIQAAEKEGLAQKGTKLGYTMNPISYPALSGYSVHPALFDFINNLANPLAFNTYDKISRFAKGAIVFDPTYFVGIMLPYLRTLAANVPAVGKIGKYWHQALKGFINASPEYISFVENGGASNPFVETKDFEAYIEKMKLPQGSLLQQTMNQILTKAGLKDLANKVANFTWTFDRLAKFSHYLMLKDRGFSSRDAAQLAAENAIDYAKMPPKTRRWLGRIFFAPVYQILSMVNDAKLLRAPFRLAKDYIRNDANYHEKNIDKQRLGYLIGTMIVLFGLDQLFQHYGYKREEFGTRYVSDFENEKGHKRENVLTPSHPLNVSARWINTFMRGMQPGETSPMEKLSGRIMTQIGPVPSYLKEISNNKTFEGKKIWNNVADTPAEIAAKIALHAGKKIEPFFVSKFVTPKEKAESKNRLKKDLGALYYLIDSILFSYDRKPSDERDIARVKQITRAMNQDAREGTLTEKRRQRYLETLEKVKK